MYLVGVDEVGRGAIAGQVVACAATVRIQSSKYKVQSREYDIKVKQLIRLGVRDSKELTPKKREELEPQIKRIVDGFGIGEASVEEINRLGIVQATWLAMKRAVEELTTKPNIILVDGLSIKPLADCQQLS